MGSAFWWNQCLLVSPKKDRKKCSAAQPCDVLRKKKMPWTAPYGTLVDTVTHSNAHSNQLFPSFRYLHSRDHHLIFSCFILLKNSCLEMQSVLYISLDVTQFKPVMIKTHYYGRGRRGNIVTGIISVPISFTQTDVRKAPSTTKFR